MIDKILISGGSITESPWLTWPDFVEFGTGARCINLAVKGTGNEQIVSSLVQNQHLINQETLVMVMLTNVDKFDWYVEDALYHSLKKEKHPPIKVSSNSGFWCTGSWFPGPKKLFKDNFFSLDYFFAKSVQQIFLLEHLVAAKKSHLIVLFDSPIWSTTEQHLNNTTDPSKPNLFVPCQKSLPYFMTWYSLLDDKYKHLEQQSLIGHCVINDLPWFNHKFKGHPPSSSHFSYYKHIIVPALNDFFCANDHRDNLELAHKISQFDKEWHSY